MPAGILLIMNLLFSFTNLARKYKQHTGRSRLHFEKKTTKSKLTSRGFTNYSSVYRYAPTRVQFMHGDGCGQGFCMHQPEFSSCTEMGVAQVPIYPPIRVQFMQGMGVVEVPICTNQSSVYARRWVWPRFLYAPIRVQFLPEMSMATVHHINVQIAVPARKERNFYVYGINDKCLHKIIYQN